MLRLPEEAGEEVRVAVALGVHERDVQATDKRPARGGQVSRHVPVVVLVDRYGCGCVRRGDEADALLHTRLPHGPLNLLGDRDELVAIVRLYLYLSSLHSSPYFFYAPSISGRSAMLWISASGAPAVPGRYLPVLTCIPRRPAFCAPATSDSASSPTIATSCASRPRSRSPASKKAGLGFPTSTYSGALSSGTISGRSFKSALVISVWHFLRLSKAFAAVAGVKTSSSRAWKPRSRSRDTTSRRGLRVVLVT